MKALSLFSGIGGIDLASEWAGIETVAFCEREPFCQKVLAKHWPNIPIYDDVCTLTKERLEADGIGTIDLIFGGYPCQPFSVAGKREGEDDDRFLWPEVKRLLEEIRPRWFVGENVAGHVTMGLDNVLSDLGNIDYSVQPFIIPACGVGAVHRRDRVFILSYTDSKRVCGAEEYNRYRVGKKSLQQRINTQPEPTDFFKVFADTNSERQKTDFEEEIQGKQILQRREGSGSVENWAGRSVLFEPKLLRNYHGIPDGMDRNKALGNAVVPQQIYPILAAIKKIDDAMRSETA